MLIVLDYDDTYTKAKNFWDETIQRAREYGHTVVCCTMRFGNPYVDKDVIDDMERNQVMVVFAAQHKDKATAMRNAGYNIENAIWIDDSPEWVYR